MNGLERGPITLVGLMGAGKTAVAELLAARLGVGVFDVDGELERESGTTVRELFARQGEAEFRRREAALFESAIASGAGVVACGGGAVLDPATRALLRARCRTVWLEVTPAEAARRVARDGATRPMLANGAPADRLVELLRERSALYGEVASVRIATDGLTPAEVADRVLESLDDHA